MSTGNQSKPIWDDGSLGDARKEKRVPRVHHVKKARKDNPVVKRGESYYWWKFRFGPKMYSRTYPKRSRLTRSGFLSTLWDIEDCLSTTATSDDGDALIADLEQLQEECECSLDNMPEQLRESSDPGMLLQERIDGLGEWIGSIYAIGWDALTPEEAADAIQDANPGVS